MLSKSYRLPFNLLGIPIYVDLSFLLILPVLALVIANDLRAFAVAFRLPIEPSMLDAIDSRFALGLAAAIGLFASILIHELGHAAVGARLGARTTRITLWLLGGMAQFESLPKRHAREAQIAIAGPITSALLAGALYFVFGVLAPEQIAMRFLVGYLMITNLVIAGFNLLPALPLDGGRVLRSLLALRMPFAEATQVAGRVARTLAILLGLLGFFAMNPLLILVALFVFWSGTAEATAATLEALLSGVHVRDVMITEVATVRDTTPLDALVQQMVRDHHRGYPVVDERGDLQGMVTLEELKRRGGLGSLGPGATVRSIMTATGTPFRPQQSAFEAYQSLASTGRPREAVVDGDGHVIGIVSTTDLLHAVALRAVGHSVAA